jgi:CheY-like chemotaxis protein
MPHIHLKALVVTPNTEQLRLWRRALGELGIEMDESRSMADAADKLARGKYEALAVDCEEVSGSTGLFMAVRSAPTSHHAMVFAIASNARLRSLRGYGINFILTKPVNSEFLGRCLRASYGSMMADQRRYLRYPVHIPVELETQGRKWKGHITNLNESGAGIFALGLAKDLRVRLRFGVGTEQNQIEADGLVVWCSPSGQAGIRFENMLPSRRTLLIGWLNERFEEALQPPGLAYRGS